MAELLDYQNKTYTKEAQDSQLACEKCKRPCDLLYSIPDEELLKKIGPVKPGGKVPTLNVCKPDFDTYWRGKGFTKV